MVERLKGSPAFLVPKVGSVVCHSLFLSLLHCKHRQFSEAYSGVVAILFARVYTEAIFGTVRYR